MIDAACNGTLGPNLGPAGKAKHLANRAPEELGDVSLSRTVHSLSLYLLCPCINSVCALLQVWLPFPTSYHLPAALTISPDQAKGGGGGDLPLAQQLISFAKHKNYYPLLSLLPAGSNHSRFIALTRKAITPLSHFSNTDVCSQHMQRLDCMCITCELFVLCFLALQVPSTFSYLSTSASRQQTALSSPFCHRTALMFDFSLG